MEFTPDHDGLFDSLESGQPFDTCIACRLPLNEKPSHPSDDFGIVRDFDLTAPYLVVKSYHKEECIFEYALCDGCRSNMVKEYSEKSLQQLKAFYERRLDVEKRSEQFCGRKKISDWIAECATCGKTRETCDQYSLGALFHSSSLILDPYPMCFCHECEEEIQASLSKETLGIWDDFIESHFDTPPTNIHDLPVGGRPLLI